MLADANNRQIIVETLTAAVFAPFGEVIEVADTSSYPINRGLCDRYHDLAALDFSDGRAAISLFQSRPRVLPLELDMVERHPLGSQAFLPMSGEPYLVIVAPDHDGKPGKPHALLAGAGQGVNYHRNVWHGVLTPLRQTALFAVVDRIGDGDNLQEHWFDEPYRITTSRLQNH